MRKFNVGDSVRITVREIEYEVPAESESDAEEK